MALYRNIRTSFWTDAKVVDDFTPEDRYFYLYLFTNPHTNLCGCYEISKSQMSIELGYTKEVIDRLLVRFTTIHNVIRYNTDTKEILLLNWHKYNWTESEKLKIALSKEIESVKCEDFKDYLFNILNDEDTLPIPYPYPMDTTNTNTNTNTISNKRFTPPTVEEVREYCLERKNLVDPETFINFYESKGWFVGKNKMKDWRACVRTWERNRNSTQKKTGYDLYRETKSSNYNFEELEKELQNRY